MMRVSNICLYSFQNDQIMHVPSIFQIVIHRYIVVCFPHRSMTLGSLKVVRLQALGSILFSIAFGIPRFFEKSIIRQDNGKLKAIKREFSEQYFYKTVWKVIVYYIVSYIIPMIILTFCTYNLIRAVNAARKKRQEMTQKSSRNKEREDVTVTLIVVVLVFMVCQISNPIRRVLAEVLESEEKGCGFFYFYYREYNSIFISINSAVNIALYCIFNKKFRDNLRAFIYRSQRIVPTTTHATLSHTQQTTKQSSVA